MIPGVKFYVRHGSFISLRHTTEVSRLQCLVLMIAIDDALGRGLLGRGLLCSELLNR